MNHHSSSGISLIEVLVALAIIVALVWVATPRFGSDLVKGYQTQTLSHMKQLHLATLMMADDGAVAPNSALGWPGDTGGSFTNWAYQLVHEKYLSHEDLCKLLSAPGVVVSTNDPLTSNRSALLVYAVSTNSLDDSAFLSTANFTNSPFGGFFDPKARPYRNESFVVYRKAGDGAILQPRQAGQTNIIGSYVPLCH